MTRDSRQPLYIEYALGWHPFVDPLLDRRMSDSEFAADSSGLAALREDFFEGHAPMVAALPSKCKHGYRTNDSGATTIRRVEQTESQVRTPPNRPDPHKDLGQRLRSARDRAGLTQEQAAERLGITYSAIGQWERGNGSMEALNLFLAAQAYGASLDWLAFGMKGPIEKRVAALPESLRDLTMTQITSALENAERAYRTNPQLFGEKVVTDHDERLTVWSAADKIRKARKSPTNKPGGSRREPKK